MNPGRSVVDSITPVLWEYLNRTSPRHRIDRIALSVDDYLEVQKIGLRPYAHSLCINVGKDVYDLTAGTSPGRGEVALVFRPGDGWGKEES